MKRWREKKPCRKCGFVRTVQVVDYGVRDFGVSWSELCGICEMFTKARRKLAEAEQMMADANVALAARQQRQIRRLAKTLPKAGDR